MANNGSPPYPAPKPRLWTTQNILMNRPFMHNPPNSLANVRVTSFRPDLQNNLLQFPDAPFVTSIPPPGCQILPNSLPLNSNFPMFNMNTYSLGGWTEPHPSSYWQNHQALNITNLGMPAMPPGAFFPYPQPTPEFARQVLQPAFGYSTNPMLQGMDAVNAAYVQNSGMAPLTLPSSYFPQRSVHSEVNEPNPGPSVPPELSHLPRNCQNPELPDLSKETNLQRPLPPGEILDQSESQVGSQYPPSNWHEPSQSSRGDYQGRQKPEVGSFCNEYKMNRNRGRGRASSNLNSPAHEFQGSQTGMAQNRNLDIDNSYGNRGHTKQANERKRVHPNSNGKYRGNNGNQQGRGSGHGYKSNLQRCIKRRSAVTSDLMNHVTPKPNTNQGNHEEVNEKSESHSRCTQTEPKTFSISPNVVNHSITSDEGQSSETPVNEPQVVQIGPGVVMLAMTLQEFRQWGLNNERRREKLAEVARLGPSRVQEELNEPDRNPTPDIVKVDLESEHEALGQEPTLGESKSPEELSDAIDTVKGLIGTELEKNQGEIAHIPISDVSQDKFPEEKTISLPVIVKVELVEANEEEEVQVPLPERPQNLANLKGQETKAVEDVLHVEQGAGQVEDSAPATFQSRDNVNGSQQITFVEMTKAISEIKQQKEDQVQAPRKFRRRENLNRPRKSTFEVNVKPELKQKEEPIDLDKQDCTKLSIAQENCNGYLKNTRLYSDIVKGLKNMDGLDKRPGNPIQEFLQKLGYETEAGKINVDAIRKEIENLKTKKEHEKVHMLEEFLKETIELPGGKELEKESEWINVINKKHKRKGIGNRSAWKADFK